jgi:hypothetical protein
MGLMRQAAGRPIDDYDNWSTDTGLTEKQFLARANLREGINGQARISTQFENVENRDEVNSPRSEQRKRQFDNGQPKDFIVPGTNPDADGDSDGDTKLP